MIKYYQAKKNRQFSECHNLDVEYALMEIATRNYEYQKKMRSERLEMTGYGFI